MDTKTKHILKIYTPVLFVFALLISFVTTNKPKIIPCANSLTCEESLELAIDNDDGAVFEGRNVDVPVIDLGYVPTEEKVLGTEAGVGEKRINIDLTTQTLKAYQGRELFMETKVSTGKWYPTPTGEFTIWRKAGAAKMSGGEGASYYYLPNVPYIMFFSNDKVSSGLGYALHGAYWHNNFGHAMSHGCVNMRTVDAQKLFYWVGPPLTDNRLVSKPGETGTKIIISGKAP